MTLHCGIKKINFRQAGGNQTKISDALKTPTRIEHYAFHARCVLMTPITITLTARLAFEKIYVILLFLIGFPIAT